MSSYSIYEKSVSSFPVLEVCCLGNTCLDFSVHLNKLAKHFNIELMA